MVISPERRRSDPRPEQVDAMSAYLSFEIDVSSGERPRPLMGLTFGSLHKILAITFMQICSNFFFFCGNTQHGTLGWPLFSGGVTSAECRGGLSHVFPNTADGLGHANSGSEGGCGCVREHRGLRCLVGH